MVRFILLYGLYLLLGSMALGLGPIREHMVRPWTQFNAFCAAWAGRLLGIEVSSQDTMLHMGSDSLEVMDGCNGVVALVVFSSAVLAFPVRWKQRIWGVGVGIVLILGFNLVRLVNLIFVARSFPQHLEFFHVFIWQVLIILMAFLLFLGWSFTLGTRRAAC